MVVIRYNTSFEFHYQSEIKCEEMLKNHDWLPSILSSSPWSLQIKNCLALTKSSCTITILKYWAGNQHILDWQTSSTIHSQWLLLKGRQTSKCWLQLSDHCFSYQSDSIDPSRTFTYVSEMVTLHTVARPSTVYQFLVTWGTIGWHRHL